MHPNLVDAYGPKVARQHAARSDPDCRDEAPDILRRLVEQVVMYPKLDDFEIELIG